MVLEASSCTQQVVIAGCFQNNLIKETLPLPLANCLVKAVKLHLCTAVFVEIPGVLTLPGAPGRNQSQLWYTCGIHVAHVRITGPFHDIYR